MPGGLDTVRVLDQIGTDMVEAKDNLMLAKVFQADHANRRCGSEDAYKMDDLVMLPTANRRKDYASTGSGWSVKFFLR